MRERLRRRVREAFRGALNQAGYDRDGRRLDSFKTKDRSSKDIKGTLEIYCRTRAGLDLDFAEIVREAANVVHKVHESWNSSSGTRADG